VTREVSQHILDDAQIDLADETRGLRKRDELRRLDERAAGAQSLQDLVVHRLAVRRSNDLLAVQGDAICVDRFSRLARPVNAAPGAALPVGIRTQE